VPAVLDDALLHNSHYKNACLVSNDLFDAFIDLNMGYGEWNDAGDKWLTIYAMLAIKPS
jgi:hypothetical protein